MKKFAEFVLCIAFIGFLMWLETGGRK